MRLHLQCCMMMMPAWSWRMMEVKNEPSLSTQQLIIITVEELAACAKESIDHRMQPFVFLPTKTLFFLRVGFQNLTMFDYHLTNFNGDRDVWGLFCLFYRKKYFKSRDPVLTVPPEQGGLHGGHSGQENTRTLWLEFSRIFCETNILCNSSKILLT